MKLPAKTWLPLLVALFPVAAFAQTWEPEECPEYTDKKVLKLIDAGTDKKKNKLDARIEYLEKAIDADEECAIAHFELGNALRTRSIGKGGPISPAISAYKRAVELCESIHSDPYYHIGMYYMDKGNWGEAADYLNKFYRFSHEDDSKFSRKYDKQIKQAQGALKYAEFMHENLSNPKPFNPVVVGNVSSDQDEYLPLISPDGTRLFFTRKSEKSETVRDAVYARENKLFIERFSVAKGKDATFDAGEPLPPPFNQEEQFNYGGATVSLDNRHLYLTVCKPEPNGYVNCDIYYSHLTYGVPTYQDMHGEQWFWTELEPLGPNVNTKDGWEAQPCISADGKTLYFATARADSKMIDIYTSTQNPDGTWAPAQPMEGPINTSRNDKSPFLHSDSETLYFASEGHMGFGGFDVYYTRKNENDEWIEPVNIGHPINSEKDEHGFVVSTDGTKVYFGSDKLKEQGTGGFDIFTFDLYQEARPEAVLFVKGKVEDAQGVPLRDAQIELKTTHSKQIARFDVDTLDGNYAAVIKVEAEDNVVVNIEAEDKAFASAMITAEAIGVVPEPELAQANQPETSQPEATRDPNATRMQTIESKGVQSGTSALLMPPTATGTFAELSFEVADIEVGKSYKLNNINYSTNSAEIDAASQYILIEFADYLKENPSLKVAIHGHTDNRGNKDDNMALSTDRAFSVMEFLQGQGIAGNRLTFKGFGPTKPIASNNTEEGRAENRRTEFVVTGR